MRAIVNVAPALVLSSLMSAPSFATTNFANETVTYVATYGNGSITIYLSTAINEPGCNPNSTRIDVQGSQPNVKQILAIALEAYISGSQISGAVNSCDPDNGAPTFDNSYNSWLTVGPAP